MDYTPITQDMRNTTKIHATVAQLDRALASEAEGCWFDPSQSHHSSLIFIPRCASHLQEMLSEGDGDGLGAVGGADFADDGLDVLVDAVDADAETGRDFLARVAADH